MQMHDWNLLPRFVVTACDTKFTTCFDAVFADEDAQVVRVARRGPNMNAFAERFVQTLKHECLDNYLVCGERLLRHLVTELLTHYHEERPQPGVGNLPFPDGNAGDGEPRILPFPSGEVRCREHLGGLVRHYFREAA